jgi:hypothetical protein
MRLAALVVLALAVAASTAVAAARPKESITIKDGRGIVQVKGNGVVVGRVDRGWLQIVDLSPNDEWSPWVNGVPRGKVVGIRGTSITFRLSNGRYKIVARGEGISISARGSGLVTLDGDPDAVGATGEYSVGDEELQPLPADPLRLPFGLADVVSSDGSAKIRP